MGLVVRRKTRQSWGVLELESYVKLSWAVSMCVVHAHVGRARFVKPPAQVVGLLTVNGPSQANDNTHSVSPGETFSRVNNEISGIART
ncbi:unnamed protein product [Ilex paraguariensis]|uniref:Uncharacterized protein n=1 Tax=Ilex paraguariensis TaxID=185542 RepID=A0ABC8T7J9_9AQUA